MPGAETWGEVHVALPAQIVAFDTETTGVDTENDRIITAFVGLFDVHSNSFVEEYHWLLDPGVEIPEGATDVHGYTTEDVQQAGMDPAIGAFEVTRTLDKFDRRGLPIAAYNARFDFTLLDREMQRHYPLIRPFIPHLVLDPYVMDKDAEPYRKGSRKLVDTARHYRVPIETNAHDAAADCLMTARLAVALLRTRHWSGRTLPDIHRRQIQSAAQQARGFAGYLRKQGRGDEASKIQTEWPLVPSTTPASTEETA